MNEPIVPTAGVVVLAGDAVLLIEHGEGAGHATGAWGIPAGGIDEGETPRDAAVRELAEETGLEVDPASLVELPELYTAPILRKSGETVTFSLRVFVAATSEGALSDSDEGVPRWVRLADVRSLPHLLANTAEIVEAAIAALP